MSWLDQAKGGLGGPLGEAGRAALPGLIEKLLPGGLQSVLDQLSSSGLGQQVNSWLGRGSNQPITVEDLRNALSNEQVRAVAERLGLPVDQALEVLAGRLPEAVDQASPEGELKTPPA
ncbi:DUF937 domain-containing protein [Chelatococcus sambhunathii]|uniref:DUF937 domain-containing protein n=1 Tax=Chelatococcus sambhunathii TaxID=363953 RepID=A0ABU1DC52_9HYPH|nr:YidB family protein [Chelatococcus sambhunathii]MDR4305614.1 DUF937 domain-containing protein [Chelatococcus sambhunathii]